MEKKINELESILEYKFNNTKYLIEALTHPSMSYKQKLKNRFNYERLEFLGDAVLSMVIAEYLFKKFPNESEGVLSKKKSILVSKDTLYKVAIKINLGKYIIMTKGEENTDGRNNVNNLENVTEAVIGAIFLDSEENGLNYAKKFILKTWKDFLNSELEYSTKTALQELVQKKYKKLPEYRLENTEIIDKQEIFTVSLTIPNFKKITMSGKNIKNIEKELARNVLDCIFKKKNNKFTQN